MKKLKLPPGVREDFDLLLVHGAARWQEFEKRFVAAFAAAWLRLQPAEKDAVLKFWGKWEKRRKPQAWVKFVDTLAPDIKDPTVWTFYEPTGGILTIVVPPCLPMPVNLFEVFVAREVRRAVRVALGVAVTDQDIRQANKDAGYDEDALQRWTAENN
jgi:hypothetical protein